MGRFKAACVNEPMWESGRLRLTMRTKERMPSASRVLFALDRMMKLLALLPARAPEVALVGAPLKNIMFLGSVALVPF